MSIRSESVSVEVPNGVVENEEQVQDQKQTNNRNRLFNAIRTFNNACDNKNIKLMKTILADTDKIVGDKKLRDLFKENTFKGDTSLNAFKNKAIELMLTNFIKISQDNDNKIDLLFWTAAKLDLEALEEIVKNLPSEAFLETRQYDSVIVFALKYGNVCNENLVSCMKLLIDVGVDVNIFDFKGKTAIDYVAQLFKNFKADALKDVAKLLLSKGIYKNDNRITEDFLTETMKLDKYEYVPMDPKTKLYYFLTTNKTQELLDLKEIKNYVNEEYRGSTILQFVSQKSDNMVSLVELLLKHGADPNRITQENPLTPLQLADSHNNQKIFAELLKHKKTKVTKEQYSQFIQRRTNAGKGKLFELLLESDKVDVNLKYEKTGNTPLHYAVLFSHKKAIQILLKRNSSLIAKNVMNKSVLDIIDPVDLETYFDSCLVLDNWAKCFSDVNYKMMFRFNCLVNSSIVQKKQTCDVEDNENLIEDAKILTFKEMKVVSQIGRQANLEYLLTHPFIGAFLSLKWFKIKIYWRIVLIFQAVIFLLMTGLFYHLPSLGIVPMIFCGLVSFINGLIKGCLFLFFKPKNRLPELPVFRRLFLFFNLKILPEFLVFKQATLHGSVELLLMITSVGSFIQDQFRAFLFVEMAVSFLLTMGYHPKLSKWSLMLQTVFQTFTVLFIFFSLIISAFGLGFRILFPNEGLFKNVYTAIFKTYIMTTGEFNVDEDTDFSYAGFGGYLLFLIFAMSMSLVIVNFWTGVAVTDIERIEKNSEINASKNVIIFMNFVEFLYNSSPTSFCNWCKRLLPDPFIFSGQDNSEEETNAKNDYRINFHVNKEKQFDSDTISGLPNRIDDDCFNKIQQHYYKVNKDSSDKTILDKLDALTKLVNDLKKQQSSGNAEIASGERKPKNYNVKKKK